VRWLLIQRLSQSFPTASLVRFALMARRQHIILQLALEAALTNGSFSIKAEGGALHWLIATDDPNRISARQRHTRQPWI